MRFCFRIQLNLSNSFDRKFSILLDALLVGHEERVYSARWHPSMHAFQAWKRLFEPNQAHHVIQPARLLTCSLDRTMVIWRPDPTCGVWVEDMRVGEVGGNNTSGLYGAVWSANGSFVVAHGFQAGFVD